MNSTPRVHWRPHFPAIFNAPTSNLPLLAAAHDVLPINEERNCQYGILTIDVVRFRPRLMNVTGRETVVTRLWDPRQYRPFNGFPTYYSRFFSLRRTLENIIGWVSEWEEQWMEALRQCCWYTRRHTCLLIESIHTPHLLGACSHLDAHPSYSSGDLRVVGGRLRSNLARTGSSDETICTTAIELEYCHKVSFCGSFVFVHPWYTLAKDYVDTSFAERVSGSRTDFIPTFIPPPPGIRV